MRVRADRRVRLQRATFTGRSVLTRNTYQAKYKFGLARSTAIDELPKDWTAQLATVMAATLRDFSSQIRDTSVVMFAIDCFPWQGSIGLSILTSEESNADPAMMDPSEIAAWRYFNFAEDLAAWKPAKALGRQMSDAYYADEDADRGAIADGFFRACAIAAASPDVARAIDLFKRDSRFRISVSHPDDRREFYAS